MHVSGLVNLLSVFASNQSALPEPPNPGLERESYGAYMEAYKAYIEAYDRARVGREGAFDVIKDIVSRVGGLTAGVAVSGAEAGVVSVGNAAMYISEQSNAAAAAVTECAAEPVACVTRKKKTRAKKQVVEQDDVPEWRRKDVGRNGKPVQPESVGFWRSCDDVTRRELIQTKAAMHVAENKRREAEALDRVKFLGSPQAAVQQAVDVVKYAEKLKAKDSVVYGYAKTVSSATAEGIVRALPDSVTSYEDYEKRKMQEENTKAMEALASENERMAAELKELYEHRRKSLLADIERLQAEKENSAKVVYVDNKVAETKVKSKKKAGQGAKPAGPGYSQWTVPKRTSDVCDDMEADFRRWRCDNGM